MTHLIFKCVYVLSHFEQILNVADVREANINVVGNWRMSMLGDLNETAISLVQSKGGSE